MKINHILLITFLGALTAFILLEGCKKDPPPQPPTTCAVCGPGCAVPTFNSNMPTGVALLNQHCVNAFMWQAFTALTWPADPNNPGEPDKSKTISDYGTPGDLTPSVFDTYKSVDEVFSDQAPTSWGSNHADIMNEHKQEGCQHRLLKMTHKFDRGGGGDDVVNEFKEAGGTNLWITDQDSNLVWSEIKVNKTEFEYINFNKLYIPEKQLELSQDTSNHPPGIIMPSNSMELKAAWRVIPEEKFDRLKSRYKTIRACVPSKMTVIPGQDGKPNQTTVSDYKEQYLGLVGLHIMAKIAKAPQFIWATFEHNDLAPVDNEPVDMSKDYLLYNKATPDAPYNVRTTDHLDPTIPTQTKKSHLANPGEAAVALNGWMKEWLGKLSPNSVFQNYHLVDTQWPSSALQDTENIVPLSKGGMTPQVVTNVTLETYSQGASCLTCHVGGSISTNGLSNLTKKDSSYSTDYSFIFSRAEPQKK